MIQKIMEIKKFRTSTITKLEGFFFVCLFCSVKENIKINLQSTSLNKGFVIPLLSKLALLMTDSDFYTKAYYYKKYHNNWKVCNM